MTEYLEVLLLAGRPYIPYIPWAIAGLLGAAWLWMWRQARRARREQRTLQEQARQEAVTLTAERDATRKAWVEHMGEVGDLRFEVLSRDKQIRDLHAKINRGWLGDLTVTAIRLRAKGGEVRLWRETIPVTVPMSAGKLKADHPSGDVMVFDYLLALGVPDPAGEKVTA